MSCWSSPQPWESSCSCHKPTRTLAERARCPCWSGRRVRRAVQESWLDSDLNGPERPRWYLRTIRSPGSGGRAINVRSARRRAVDHGYSRSPELPDHRRYRAMIGPIPKLTVPDDETWFTSGRHAGEMCGWPSRTRRRSIHASRNLSRAPPASLRDRLRRAWTEPVCCWVRQQMGSGRGRRQGGITVGAPVQALWWRPGPRRRGASRRAWPGATLGATETNDFSALRTSLDSRQERIRGDGPGADARTGIRGSEGRVVLSPASPLSRRH
jgi:hypothetical protein